MKLGWSHAVLYVQEEASMLAFYTRVLGFQVVDRGPLDHGAPDIIFLSQDADEHHQLAMVPVRRDSAPSNSVNHFAFRTDCFKDIQRLHEVLMDLDGISVAPLSHGNTLSIYFNEPEGNGLEVFWDTPWHVSQPQGKRWDISLDEGRALLWVQEQFGHEPGFCPREAYAQQRRLALER